MELNVQTWKEFNLLNLCKIDMGNKFDNDKMTHEEPCINFVSRTGNNNGVSDIVDRINGVEPYPANSISVALGGSIGSCFLQTKPFYTGQNISVLLFDNSVSNQVKLFITTMFMNECKYKYVAFGRELNVHIRKDFTFYLPIQHSHDGIPIIDEKKTYSDEGYIPDWDFMEQYIKTLNCKPPTTKVGKKGILDLNIEKWEEFCVGDIFDIKKGKRLTAEDQTDGYTPYIGAIDSNNGVANYIGQKAIHDGNTISLSYNGSVGEAFYQPKPFWATDDVNVLYFRPQNNIIFNKYIALFFCAVLRQEKYRYSYGRKWVLESMRTTTIKLPANDGKPDYAFMERYMRALPYGDRI